MSAVFSGKKKTTTTEISYFVFNFSKKDFRLNLLSDYNF